MLPKMASSSLGSAREALHVTQKLGADRVPGISGSSLLFFVSATGTDFSVGKTRCLLVTAESLMLRASCNRSSRSASSRPLDGNTRYPDLPGPLSTYHAVIFAVTRTLVRPEGCGSNWIEHW